MTTFIMLHIAVFIIAFIVFYSLILRNARLRAKFRLYKIRDRLILLIAQDKLSEDNPVFVHFYNRVNSIIGQIPFIGIDDVLHAVLLFDGSKDYRTAIERTQAKLEKLWKDPALENPEVRSVVKDYLSAVEYTIIVHSSWMRVFYLASRLLTKKLVNSIAEVVAPQSARHAVASIHVFEEAEARLA
jgi:hypothetical protein